MNDFQEVDSTNDYINVNHEKLDYENNNKLHSTTNMDENKKKTTTTATPVCPYYLFSLDKLNKVEIPSDIRDFMLWKDPRITGPVFGSILVLLFSLATFSLLTVVGALFLLISTTVGLYRLYTSIMFRIKGTQDDKLEKISKLNVSLPRDQVQRLINFFEKDLNNELSRIRSIILWDNIINSGIAFAAFYFIYCLGSWFNTLTLLILFHISVFTLPKLYVMNKVQIDQGIQKATDCVHAAIQQAMVKIPFLNKKNSSADKMRTD